MAVRSRVRPLFRISSEWLFALGCIGLAKVVAYLLFVWLRKKPIRLGGWAVNVPAPRMTALQLAVVVLAIFGVAALATVAPGIAEALVATAIGLFAAIPAVVAYNRFARDIDRIATAQETFIEEFSNILQRNASTPSHQG